MKNFQRFESPRRSWIEILFDSGPSVHTVYVFHSISDGFLQFHARVIANYVGAHTDIAKNLVNFEILLSQLLLSIGRSSRTISGSQTQYYDGQ